MSVRSHLGGALIVEHRSGDSPPILALHGWGRDRSDMAALVAGREAMLPDLPGFGSSPPPPEAWGAAEYAKCLADLLAADARAPYVVAAHSFGGRAAVELAADYPALVSGVLLCGVPLLRAHSSARPKASLRLARWASKRGLVSEQRVDKLRERYGSADYKAAHGVMRAVLVRSVAEDYSEPLQRVQAPIGFCWGERDTAATLDVAKRAAAMAQNVCCFDVVAGVGHDVILQAPERARAALEQVIEAACKS